MRNTVSNPKNQGLKVAILGHRGIPNSYGGFETFAEEMADCLVGLGCRVTVYCRKNYFNSRPKEYKGAALVYLPTITKKIFDTPVHSFLSVLHLLFKNTADVVVIVNVGNAPFAGLAKLFGKKVIFCVDGLDWQRKKWGLLARWYLAACSYLASLVAHEIVTDAASVQEFYKTCRHTESTLIPYGTDIETYDQTADNILKEHNLEPKKYFSYVARFEPENNPLLVVEAYVKSDSVYPLVMVGDNRYNPDYVKRIKAAANNRVLFLGYVFGARYKKLVKNSLAYVRAAEVGGASPAVIEAMGRSVCVLANDKPENREILSDTGLFYTLTTQNLAALFRQVTENPEKALALGTRAGQRAALVYSWDRIAYEYYKIIRRLSKTPAAEFSIDTPRAGGTKRILMTGAGGMLGQAMYEHFSKDCKVMATDVDTNEPYISYLDVRDYAAYAKAVTTFRPDYIFHLAALTSLEACENNKANAYATNALAVKYAAQLAGRNGAKLVYVSSAGTFDGQKDFYVDDDEPKPINTYGLTKQMGALMTEYYARNFLIIRPGWMMGGGPGKDKKFVNSIVAQIIAGQKTIHAVTDKLGTPSYTHDLAKNLDVLLRAGNQGTYNMASSGFASRYDVAKEIVKILGYEKRVKVLPVDSSYFSHTFFANRPPSENLVNERLAREGLNRMRPWQTALREYLKRDYEYAFTTQTRSFNLIPRTALA